jgi:phosphatidate cytidylyltransferase
VTPAEGVRILGAEEAQVALSNDQGVLNLSREEEVETGGDSGNRDVAYPDRGPSWSAAPEAADSTAEVPPLPHWTEPPTGAVPAIFADDTGEHNELDEDLDVWAPVTGAQPRFRSEGSDWADADFADDLSDSGEHAKLGALDEQGPVDEEAAFAEALDRRRKRPVRRARAPKAAVSAAAATAASTPRSRPPQPRPPANELAPPGPAQSRDLPTAVLTGLIVAIGALICFKQGPAWTTALAALVVGVAGLEFCAALRSKGLRTATLLAFVACLTIPVAAYNYGTNAYPMFFGLVAVFTMLWFLWEVTPGRPLIGVATTVLAFAYVGGLGGFSGLLLARPSGVGLILGVVLCVIAYDVAGFFVGSQWGRTPIAPKVSPNKSVQGTVGGMAASVIVGTVLVGQIHPWDAKWGFLLGCLVAIGAFLGDLCESMIKRDIGLKDFGTLLPGHGGVLDRFDGLLFCLPIAYYLAVAAKLV